MPITRHAAGGSLAEPGFGCRDMLRMVRTELHEQPLLLAGDVSSGQFGLVAVVENRYGPHTPRPADAGQIPTSPVGLNRRLASPTVGQSDRPSDRVADRPSELSRNNLSLRRFEFVPLWGCMVVL